MRAKPLMLAAILAIVLGLSAAPARAQVFVESGSYVGFGVQPGYVAGFGGAPWIAPGAVVSPAVPYYPTIVPGSTILVRPGPMVVPRPYGYGYYRPGRVFVPRSYGGFQPWRPRGFIYGRRGWWW